MRSRVSLRAFTLIELVVVMAIMAGLATIAALSLGGTMDRYHLNRAVETIEMFDAKARRQARTSRQPIEATIERHRNRLLIQDRAETTSLKLPRSVEITSIRMPKKVITGSRLGISYSREGSSPTYAVELKRGKLRHWLVVIGASGQVIGFTNEGEVDELFSF